MNEQKIKELVLATGVVEYDWRENMKYSSSEELVERLIEVVVRECIKSTLSLHDTAIDNEWDLDETFHMIVDTIVEDLDMQHIFRGEE